jgi:hypothetical protein
VRRLDRVVEHVRKALLDNPVDGRLRGARHRGRCPGDGEVHEQSGAADIVNQGVQAGQVWLWRELGRPLVEAPRAAGQVSLTG